MPGDPTRRRLKAVVDWMFRDRSSVIQLSLEVPNPRKALRDQRRGPDSPNGVNAGPKSDPSAQSASTQKSVNEYLTGPEPHRLRGCMVERYTEHARKVLLFARYEAGEYGSSSIETEYLLLALLRNEKGLASRILARSHLSLATIGKEVMDRKGYRERVTPFSEITFSAETIRVLQFAAEDADRLRHNHIGTEHLLLGVLSEPDSVAATMLTARGITSNGVRDALLADAFLDSSSTAG